MTLVLILTAIFNISLLVLLFGIAWCGNKSVKITNEILKEQRAATTSLSNLWIYYSNAEKEQIDTNKKLDEVYAFLKLTFNKDFAKKIEDVMRIKENVPNTVKVRCDDGEEHELAVDDGF